MTEPIEFDRPGDPLYHGLELKHVLELPVLGILVRFESNSAHALALADEAFGAWRDLLAATEVVVSRTVTVRLIVHEGDEGGALHAPITCRMPTPDRVIVHTPGSLGIADCRRGEGIAYITPSLLADRAHVRRGLIEGVVLPLVTWYDRYPVHAAAIAHGHVALLVAGPPGAGKSTLAYAAHRQGLRVLSDDAAYIQLEPHFRIWGMPGPLYLLPSSRAHFPELADCPASLRADGHEKLAVEISGDGRAGPARPPITERAGVCLLTGRGARASQRRATADDVRAFLTTAAGWSQLRFRETSDQALALVSTGGGWRLELSSNPAEAIPLVLEMLAELETQV